MDKGENVTIRMEATFMLDKLVSARIKRMAASVDFPVVKHSIPNEIKP